MPRPVGLSLTVFLAGRAGVRKVEQLKRWVPERVCKVIAVSHRVASGALGDQDGALDDC